MSPSMANAGPHITGAWQVHGMMYSESTYWPLKWIMEGTIEGEQVGTPCTALCNCEGTGRTAADCGCVLPRRQASLRGRQPSSSPALRAPPQRTLRAAHLGRLTYTTTSTASLSSTRA